MQALDPVDIGSIVTKAILCHIPHVPGGSSFGADISV